MKPTADRPIANAYAHLPEELQDIIAADVSRFKSYGLTEEDLRHEAVLRARRIEDNFMDKLFEPLPNKEFARLMIKKHVDDLIEVAGGNPDVFKRMIKISIDLNGVKPVNDITRNHDMGKAYIGSMLELLQSSEVQQCAAGNGFSFVIMYNGTDEYDLIASSTTDEPIERDSVKVFMQLIVDRFREHEDHPEILDFSDDDILASFGGYTSEQLSEMGDEESAQVMQEIRSAVPEGYVYRGSTAIGAERIYESIAEADIQEGDDYSTCLVKIADAVLKRSDARMEADKHKFKAKLKRSENEHDQFTARLLTRTDDEVRLQGLGRVQQAFIAQVKEALAEGTLLTQIKELVDEYSTV